MRFEAVYFFFKKFIRDAFAPLIYDINTEKEKDLNAYYFLFRERELLSGGSQNFSFDTEGIPIIPTYIDVEGNDYHYYPISIGQYGLAIYHTFLESNSEEDKNRFLKIARWFLDHQTSDGYWLAEVEENKYGLDPGWPSAMAQGRGISVLLRAYQLTDEEVYMSSANKALSTFDPDTPIVITFKNQVFYEEYPTDPPSLVLNGMIFTLFGVYDYYRVKKDTQSKKIFDEGISALKGLIEQYDIGYWTLYDLRNISWGANYKNIATVHYHYIHIRQMQILHYLTEDNFFRETADRWESYASSLVNKTRMYINKAKIISKRYE